MKKFNWIVTFLLGMLTVSIYTLYMWYVMAKNGNKMAEKSNVQKITGFGMAFLLGIVTFGIYLLYWFYKFFKQQVEIAKANGIAVKPVDSPILLMILTCIPVYSYYMVCNICNNNVDASAPRFA